VQTVAQLRGRPAEKIALDVRSAAERFAGRLRDDLEVMVLRLT
jgi:hypothetical protein